MCGRCGVDVGSMWGRCRVDVGSMWGGCRRGRKRRENNKIVEEGIIKTKGYDVIGVNSFLPKKGD